MTLQARAAAQAKSAAFLRHIAAQRSQREALTSSLRAALIGEGYVTPDTTNTNACTRLSSGTSAVRVPGSTTTPVSSTLRSLAEEAAAAVRADLASSSTRPHHEACRRVAVGDPLANAVVMGLHAASGFGPAMALYTAVLEARRSGMNVVAGGNKRSGGDDNGVPADLPACFLRAGVAVHRLDGAASCPAMASPLWQELVAGRAVVVAGASQARLLAHSLATGTPAAISHLDKGFSSVRSSPASAIVAALPALAALNGPDAVLLPKEDAFGLVSLLRDTDTLLLQAARGSSSSVSSPPRSPLVDSPSLPAYWASGGTCLGALRGGGLIPWDDDIDLCVPQALMGVLQSRCGFLRDTTSALGGTTSPSDAPRLCLEYNPLFGYKVYRGAGSACSASPSPPTAVPSLSSTLTSSFLAYGTFVDLFAVERQDGDGRWALAHAAARSTWPHETWTVEDTSQLSRVAFSSDTRGDEATTVLAGVAECRDTDSTTVLVAKESADYLARTFDSRHNEGDRNATNSRSATRANGHGGSSRGGLPVGGWHTVGMIPRELHGRRYSHSTFVPIPTAGI